MDTSRSNVLPKATICECHSSILCDWENQGKRCRSGIVELARLRMSSLPRIPHYQTTTKQTRLHKTQIHGRITRMKILKAGNVPPRAIKYRGKCSVCRCEVEVFENDPELKGGVGDGLFVKCPTEGCWAHRIVMTEYIFREA